MPERFPNLYDRTRWRRYGYPLLGVGVVGVVLGAAFSGRAAGLTDVWILLGAGGLGIGLSLWVRQRMSFVRLDGEQLFFRFLTVSVRIDLADVRRARVAKLASALQRRARAPRSLADADALVLRLRHPDSGRLRRLLTRRCVFGDEVVIPLGDAAALERLIEAALVPRRQSAGDAGRLRPPASRRRGRRR